MNHTLNKYQIADTVAIRAKVISIHLDEDGSIKYELQNDSGSFYAEESEITEVF
jgi:hypothetical protein